MIVKNLSSIYGSIKLLYPVLIALVRIPLGEKEGGKLAKQLAWLQKLTENNSPKPLQWALTFSAISATDRSALFDRISNSADTTLALCRAVYVKSTFQ